MIYLSVLEKCRGGSGYPWDTKVMQENTAFRFEQPVTLLCGDNGCGKTTLIELIAAKLRAERISTGGALSAAHRSILNAADGWKSVMKAKPQHCFLFTAEGFTRYIDYVANEKRFAQEELDALDGKYGSDYARQLAAQPFAGTLHALEGMYDRPLEQQSHGQGFLDFFRSRLRPNGLYLLDEPEAALSYVNQLALIYLMQEAENMGSQFIVATHSPILMAYPRAALYEMQNGILTRKSYREMDSIRFLRRFLSDPDSLLRDENE